MRKRLASDSIKEAELSDARGFSVIEMLIIVAIIGIISAFAFMQIAKAQRAMYLPNAAREFTSHVEKARSDSIRRHATIVADMARVAITASNTYTVTMDMNGDGTAETRTITISQPGVSFNTSGMILPVTIRFNWRGRTVDDSGAYTTVADINMQDGSNSRTLRVTASGDAGSGSTATPGSISVTSVNPPVRTETKVTN